MKKESREKKRKKNEVASFSMRYSSRQVYSSRHTHTAPTRARTHTGVPSTLLYTHTRTQHSTRTQHAHAHTHCTEQMGPSFPPSLIASISYSAA
jgi:hypothetical protein